MSGVVHGHSDTFNGVLLVGKARHVGSLHPTLWGYISNAFGGGTNEHRIGLVPQEINYSGETDMIAVTGEGKGNLQIQRRETGNGKNKARESARELIPRHLTLTSSIARG